MQPAAGGWRAPQVLDAARRRRTGGTQLLLIAQIVGGFAVALDLAALGPGLPDQTGLMQGFLATGVKRCLKDMRKSR